MKYFLSLLLIFSSSIQAHHWFQETYDVEQLMTVEIEVTDVRFTNPHPFFSARVIDALSEDIDAVGDMSEEWELQMDNLWELQELGFTKETFLPGDRMTVTSHPGIFSRNVFYVKAIEHPRLDFRYEHNVRQLLELTDP